MLNFKVVIVSKIKNYFKIIIKIDWIFIFNVEINVYFVELEIIDRDNL